MGLREQWPALMIPFLLASLIPPWPFEGLVCADTCGLCWRPCMPPCPLLAIALTLLCSVGSGNLSPSLKRHLMPSLSLMAGRGSLLLSLQPGCCPEHPVLTSLRLTSDAMSHRFPRPHALDATWPVMLYVTCCLRQDKLQILTKPVFSLPHQPHLQYDCSAQSHLP